MQEVLPSSLSCAAVGASPDRGGPLRKNVLWQVEIWAWECSQHLPTSQTQGAD